MPIIILHTEIRAPIDRVFDLSRSIDLHKLSAQHTAEEAIAGRTEGLIEKGEWVQFRARHFGIRQTLTTRITEMHAPHFFSDEMVQGIFQRFRHAHHFTVRESATLMKDEFDYTAPMGWLGRIADRLFLEAYMRRFLEIRNQEIKQIAESDRWRQLLPDTDV
ncbi:MAG: SRPBCC family protein [Bacteroidota bacterium]